MFEKDDSAWGFKPHQYECPICGDERIIHISDLAHPYGTKGIVVHLTFKCIDCYSTVTHSIPIKKEYAEELRNRRGGVDTYAPWSEQYQDEDDYFDVFTDEQKETVKTRLESLGYF